MHKIGGVLCKVSIGFFALRCEERPSAQRNRSRASPLRLRLRLRLRSAAAARSGSRRPPSASFPTLP